MIGLNAARTQEHAGTRRLVASQLRKRRVTPALNNALEVKYRLSMTDQIQVFHSQVSLSSKTAGSRRNGAQLHQYVGERALGYVVHLRLVTPVIN